MANTVQKPMIDLLNVSKTYKVKEGRKIILNGVTANLPWKNIGILGRNGAGKSTFLRLVAGIEECDAGIIKRKKSLSWPIGFRGSFHPMLSGIENVRFVSRLYGQNTEELIDKVEAFAELGPFFYEPVRTYSSGMGARLAFGLSLAVDFEVYLVDEIMAVGDARFQAKSKAAFKEVLPKSKLLMVSHNMASLREYCEAGLVISDGRMTYFENLEDAIKRYEELNK